MNLGIINAHRQGEPANIYETTLGMVKSYISAEDTIVLAGIFFPILRLLVSNYFFPPLQLFLRTYHWATRRHSEKCKWQKPYPEQWQS
jgi:hypothetical protein